MLNSIKKVTSNTISKTVISSHLESPINQTLKPSSINNINTIQPLLPDHSFNLQNNQTQPNNHGQKHIEYQSIIPNLHNVKYNQLLSIPASPNDKTLLNEHLCLFNAYIRLYDPLSAEILLHKLHRYNYGNFRQSSQVKHLNDLIEAYLQIDSIQGTKSDHDKARQIYEQKKFTFKPNVDTFALFSTYYMKHEMIEQMINLLIDMKTLGVSLKMLVEHYRFQNEIDLALLTTFMKKCNSPIDHIVEANCEIKNLLLDTAQEDFDQEEYELSKMNDSIETSDKQSNEGLKLILSDSVNVVQLEKTLSNFRQDTSDLFKLQETLELESRTLAIIEEEGNLDNLPEYLQKFTGHSRQLIREWHASLLPYIRNELKHPTLSLQLRPFLKLLKPEKIALLTIICFLHVPSSTEQKAGEVMGRIKLTALSVAIGSSIETEINSQALTKHIDKQKTKGAMYDLHVKGKLVDPRLRNVAMDMARRELEKRNTWMPKWSPTVTIGIGSLLASLVVMSAKFKSQPATHLSLLNLRATYVPAFFHTFISEKSKQIGCVQYNDALIGHLLAVETQVPPKHLPMLVQPRPWITWKSGGYLTDVMKTDMARIGKHPQHRQYMDAADQSGHLGTLFHALDCLGSTGWRMNVKVLEVAKMCWNTGLAFPSLVSGTKKHIDTFKASGDSVQDAKARRMQRKQVSEEMNRFSQRCDANYKLLIADAFKNDQVFFPHFLDFRGRGYPIPQYLNHIGNDLCRGLMIFGQAKPLGRRGLVWLKIQLANLYGADKISFTEREMFAEENLVNVFDSADQPLDGQRWWLKAEDPWQCLATCIELAAALRSPDPTKYMSNLPIHQDGTCNGLQHYAALGGDLIGAKLVNLVPGEKPGDVYSGVASKVAALVKEDAKNGIKLAIQLDGFISRKVVKQTVMTNTYGVTKIGAQIQVHGRLKEITGLKLSEVEYDMAARYVTLKIFETMENVFEGARLLQIWLTESASQISSSVVFSELSSSEKVDTLWCEKRGLIESSDQTATPIFDETSDSDLTQAAEDELFTTTSTTSPIKITNKKDVIKMASVVWTSPLGLPVVQPYWNHKTKLVKTSMQSITFYDYSVPCAVDKRKQTMAFPPNYIHSLDAAHMQLSAIACKSARIDFAAVHDSYWSHACDIDTMNSVLREAFIRLHGEDLMTRLREEFIERYKGHRVKKEVVLVGKDAEAYYEDMTKSGKKIARMRRKHSEEYQKTLNVWTEIVIQPLPPKGSFNIDIVKNSPYFFH